MSLTDNHINIARYATTNTLTTVSRQLQLSQFRNTLGETDIYFRP